MRYFHGSRTINIRPIASVLEVTHGSLGFLESEVAIRDEVRLREEERCQFADIYAVYGEATDRTLVGIEVKDWKNKVMPGLAQGYLDTYGPTCEYFYLAANAFSPGVHDIPELGLIDLGRLRLIRKARRLAVPIGKRAAVIRRLKDHFGLAREIIEDPYQRSLSNFA